MSKKYELNASDLRCICDPKVFTFKNTSEIEPLDEVIGQERAVQAIEFGLNMKSPDYNIFVTGIEGTGKSTIIKDIVGKHAQTLPAPMDWCMVNNFKDEYRPKAIAVPTGQAKRFSKTMNRLIEGLKVELLKAFEHESYQERKAEVQKQYADRQRNIIQEMEKAAAQKEIQINRTKTGYQTIPVVKGKAISPEEFLALPQETRDAIEKNIEAVQAEIESSLREINKLNQALNTKLEKLMQDVTLFVVKGHIEIIKELYKNYKDIIRYLNEVQADILENVKDFIAPREGPQLEGLMLPAAKPSFQRYEVNVLVEQESMEGAPVIFETNPTYHNVFGQIEKRAHMGTLTTDFTLVQAGSLLRANGGYLIMEIESILMNQYVWEALKRAVTIRFNCCKTMI